MYNLLQTGLLKILKLHKTNKNKMSESPTSDHKIYEQMCTL